MPETKLFLDAFHEPGYYAQKMKYPMYKNLQWKEAKTFQDFQYVVEKYFPTIVSINHDLDASHIRLWNDMRQMFTRPVKEYSIVYFESQLYDKMTVKSGYHCMKWLRDLCMQTGRSLPKVYVHGDNRIGNAIILRLVESYHDLMANVHAIT